MISKELFVEAINSIMNLNDYQIKKYELGKKYGVDGYLIEPSNDDILIKVIKETFGKCEEAEAIEKFCYTNNFGRGKGNQYYTDSDGQKIKITSPEELYEYLVTKKCGDAL